MNALEVAVLDRARPRRAFRRVTGAALGALLPTENRASDQADQAEPPEPGRDATS